MTRLKALRNRLRSLWASEAVHHEIETEVQFHLDMQTEENIRRGMSPEEARLDAVRRFGDHARIKEHGYDVRGGGLLESLWHDLRFSARMLHKNRVFTMVVVLTLSLGIGANTAIFSVVNALLLRPLPYRDAEQLVILWNSFPGHNTPQDWLSPGEYQEIRSQNHVFEETAILQGRGVNLIGKERPERIDAARVSASLFTLLNVHPARGRLLLPEEDQAGRPLVVVLSHGFWERRFGSDSGILGQTLTLDGQSYQVVGILPPDFDLNTEVTPLVGEIERADVLLPLGLKDEQWRSHAGRDRTYNILGRLKPGVTVAQAQTEMETIAARLGQDYPQQYTAQSAFRIGVVPLLEQAVSEVRTPLFILLGASIFVLLIACMNVANLLLSRAVGRQKELALRAALGADRRRLIRQLLTESLLLALLGGGLGLLLALLGTEALRSLGPGNIPRLSEVGIDPSVAIFTCTLSLLTGLIFGLAPALRASQVDLNEALKEGSRNVSGGNQHRLRNMLVISEIAFSLVLLVGAGLLIRSFSRLQKVDPGFNSRNVLTLRIALHGPKYPDPVRLAFYRQLEERVSLLPGAEAAGLVTALPFSGALYWGSILIEGYRPVPGEEVINTDLRTCSTNYFRTMGIPLSKGRYFTEQDDMDAPKVAIIDESMARRYWPNDDPIGKRLRPGDSQSQSPWVTVVGVVGRVKQYALETDTRVALYYPSAQMPRSTMYLVVRSAADPASLVTAINAEVRGLDSELSVFDVATMDERLSVSLARRRFSLLLLGAFAALALLLAGVGIYGVMSYSVTQRTHEIGIRMALGAQTNDVMKLVVGQGMTLALIGVAGGLAIAFALTRLMTSLLFNVSATDPVVFTLITLLLVLVALAACYLPARRATKVDPLAALRQE